MTRTRYDKFYKELTALYQAGNYNRFAITAAEHLSRPFFFRLQVKRAIVAWLSQPDAQVSDQAYASLKLIDDKDILKALAQSDKQTPQLSFGEIYFPVATTIGFIRRIKIFKDSHSRLSPSAMALADTVGGTVFDVLEESVGLHFFWDPTRYYFALYDHRNVEDHTIEGKSLGLPLALAMFSYVTRMPVPMDICATARVTRDGSILPVSSLPEKVAALQSEKPQIRYLMVSQEQPLPDDIHGIEFVRVSTVEQAIAYAFKKAPSLSNLTCRMDLDREILRIQRQYKNFFIDTCMRNIQRLMDYLESPHSPVLPDKKVYGLFICYWRYGSCLCQRGKIVKALGCLEKAKEIFNRNRGSFDYDAYLNLQISYAVVLKDFFCYSKAAKIHRQVNSELARIGSKDHFKGKNYSAQSQLCLAQKNYEQAAILQKKAIRLINDNERYRNENYLAQIYVRNNQFRTARYHMDRAGQLLDTATSDEKLKNRPFLDWIRAEYLYRKGVSLKRPVQVFSELEELAGRYNVVDWYVPALIHKFYALSQLRSKGYLDAREGLEQVTAFFNNKMNPIHRLILLSIRAELALWQIQNREMEMARPTIKGICLIFENQHPNIRKIFDKQYGTLSSCLHNTTGDTARGVLDALQSVVSQIPY